MSVLNKLGVLLLTVGILGLTPDLSLARECRFVVKNCIPTGYGGLVVRAYNFDDKARLVADSESGWMSWGQSAELWCGSSNGCELSFDIQGVAPLGSIGDPKDHTTYCGSGGNITVQRSTSGGGPSTRFMDGTETCAYNSEDVPQ